jgi:broad specificity phosphatase PhoE
VVPNQTSVMLIRHARSAGIAERLVGRSAGVELSGEGAAEADRLGRRLAASFELTAVYSSPLIRARRTAAAVARYQSVPWRRADDLVEVDFGGWTGKTFAELESDWRWHAFNRARGSAVVPGGESPRQVQRRILGAISRLAGSHAGGVVALVTHAELVRFALLHYFSLPLDDYHRLDIAPASVSAVRVSPAGGEVLWVNDVTYAAQSILFTPPSMTG